MLKIFQRKGEIQLSRERGSGPPTDLAIPSISCSETQLMWSQYQENPWSHGKHLIFLLGHLADRLGEHYAACPVNSDGALEQVRQTYWNPS